MDAVLKWHMIEAAKGILISYAAVGILFVSLYYKKNGVDGNGTSCDGALAIFLLWPIAIWFVIKDHGIRGAMKLVWNFIKGIH